MYPANLCYAESIFIIFILPSAPRNKMDVKGHHFICCCFKKYAFSKLGYV